MSRHTDLQILTAFVKSIRPPEDIRDKLDIGAMKDSDGIKIFERRPFWDDPEHIMYSPIAKLKYVKKTDVWRLFWMRGTLTWDVYKPFPESKYLNDLLEAVRHDECGCFWG